MCRKNKQLADLQAKLDASLKHEEKLQQELSAALCDKNSLASHNATLQGLLQQLLLEAQDLQAATEAAAEAAQAKQEAQILQAAAEEAAAEAAKAKHAAGACQPPARCLPVMQQAGALPSDPQQGAAIFPPAASSEQDDVQSQPRQGQSQACIPSMRTAKTCPVNTNAPGDPVHQDPAHAMSQQLDMKCPHAAETPVGLSCGSQPAAIPPHSSTLVTEHASCTTGETEQQPYWVRTRQELEQLKSQTPPPPPVVDHTPKSLCRLISLFQRQSAPVNSSESVTLTSAHPLKRQAGASARQPRCNQPPPSEPGPVIGSSAQLTPANSTNKPQAPQGQPQPMSIDAMGALDDAPDKSACPSFKDPAANPGLNHGVGSQETGDSGADTDKGSGGSNGPRDLLLGLHGMADSALQERQDNTAAGKPGGGSHLCFADACNADQLSLLDVLDDHPCMGLWVIAHAVNSPADSRSA